MNAIGQTQTNKMESTDLLTHSVYFQFYMELITQENITLVCESQWYELVAPGGDFADRN